MLPARIIRQHMPLQAGTRFGPYEVVALIGAGGMGEVWLATELRLGRKVALKLLPPDLTRDPSRILRFEQEARAASALNHPNVCTIHALAETNDGQHYIAMEYVEGETLRRRLTTSRLSLREALDIAIQVAAALSVAHAAGIVHRDIKPENVMLRPDGVVKVLDFGLAKLAPVAPGGADTTQMGVNTDAGTVVGTVAVHVARTGPWAAGGRADGHLVARRDALRDGRRAQPVRRAERQRRARRDPPERTCARGALRAGRPGGGAAHHHQDAAEGPLAAVSDRAGPAARPAGASRRFAFARTSGSAPVPAIPTEPAPSGSSPTVVPPAPEATPCGSLRSHCARARAVAGVWTWRTARPAQTPATPTSAAVQRSLTRLTFAPGLQTDVTFSPDGRFIAYASDQGGNFDIWVQPTAGGGDPVQVTKSPAADTEPDWSPDGGQIVFRSERDGGGLFVVSALGGPERRLTAFGVRPKWSPDGSLILFLSAPAGLQGTRLFVVGTDGSPPQRVLERFTADVTWLMGWAWHPDGRRVSLLGQTRSHPQTALHTVPIDGGSPIMTTVPQLLHPEGGNRVGAFAWGASGAAMYFELSVNFVSNLWRLDMDVGTLKAGTLVQLTAGAGQDTRMAISRDGTKVAFTTKAEAIRLWSYRLDAVTGRIRGSAEPVTDATMALPVYAELAPDGRQLAYAVTGVGTGRWELWIKDLVTGRTHVLSRDNHDRFAPHWSPDSRRLVYYWDAAWGATPRLGGPTARSLFVSCPRVTRFCCPPREKRTCSHTTGRLTETRSSSAGRDPGRAPSCRSGRWLPRRTRTRKPRWSRGNPHTIYGKLASRRTDAGSVSSRSLGNGPSCVSSRAAPDPPPPPIGSA